MWRDRKTVANSGAGHLGVAEEITQVKRASPGMTALTGWGREVSKSSPSAVPGQWITDLCSAELEEFQGKEIPIALI